MECDEFEDSLEYSFYTAWCSCEPVIKALAAMYPDVRIEYSYYEPGCCFCGKRDYENGQLTYSVDGDYNEQWFDFCDEDEDENLMEKNSPGVFYTVKDENDFGPATTYNFTYRDTDAERSIYIEGFCCDARAERKAFTW